MVKKITIKKYIPYILISVIIPIQLVLFLEIFGTSFISPIIVKELSKNPNNIKNGGCLIYTGKWQNSIDMYSLNNQFAKKIEHLTIKEFPFQKKWESYDSNFHIKFKEKYIKECFKVKYVKHKFIWRSNDYIYDLE